MWTHKNMSLLLHPCLRECDEEKGMLSFGNGMGRLKILEERDDLDKLTWKMIDSYIEKIPLAVDKVIERAKKKLPRRKDELQIRYEAYQKDQMLIADLALISGWNSGNWDVLENILSSDSASKLKASYQDPPQDSELAGIKTCVAFRETLPDKQKKILADWNTGDILTLSYTVETVRRAYQVYLRDQPAEEKKIEKITLWTRLKAYRSKLTEKDQNSEKSGEEKPADERSVYEKCLEWQNFFHVASKKSKDMQEKALQNAELARTLAKTACEKMKEIKKKWDPESAKVESESTTKASNLAADDVEICFKSIMTFGDVGWYDFKQYDYPDECFPKS